MNLNPDTPISYPKSDHSTQNPSISVSRQVLNDRLYIGNLHPSVDEYSLLQLFSKYGKITKLDFLFHKSGPLKGKPRGYAFVEYGEKDEAQKALASAHDKLFRGRKLVVTYAQQAPAESESSSSRPRRSIMDTGRPTTLSLLKSGSTGYSSKRQHDPIALMEAKLRQMEASKMANLEPSSSTLPTHPSLPSKPPPTDPSAEPPPRPKPSLFPSSTGSSGLRLTAPPKPASTKAKPAGLSGVKIVKKKDKPAEGTS
ncbi:RNA-binding domain-containing protein [Marasmius fiardii PR-910]|nr:RNA-binding domain-containing protein [Marasmius fiardii PR-910]